MDALSHDLSLALTFVWVGLVLGLSFLEAPLKFRAPGVTTALGLGIGRLVFRALNAAELLLALLLVALGLLGDRGTTGWVLTLVLTALLLGQTWLLRARMDPRAVRIVAGDDLPPSRLHLVYIAAETVKLSALIALGVTLLA